MGGLGGAGRGPGGLGVGAGSPVGTGGGKVTLYLALWFKILYYYKINSLYIVHGFYQILTHLSHQLNEHTGCKIWMDYIYLCLFQCPKGFGTGALGGQGYQPGELLYSTSVLLVPVGEIRSSIPSIFS